MKIRMERPNRLGRQLARQRIADEISRALAEHREKISGLRVDWLPENPQSDTLNIVGSVYGTKVNGSVNISEETLAVDVDLSGPLTWLVKKDTVESQLSKELERLGL